jgi:phosphoenolpyruvate carboxykinase (ATP)
MHNIENSISLFIKPAHTIKCKTMFRNLSMAVLVEEILKNSEGVLSSSGSIMVETGEFTGRSPEDKYIVDYGNKYDDEIEWGKVNQRISPDHFSGLLTKITSYCKDKDLYVQDVIVGADAAHQRKIRILSEYAWSALFAKNLFIDSFDNDAFDPDFTVIQVPGFKADPKEDGVITPTFVIIDFEQKLVMIGNTSYAGEIKKSVFTVMNRILPSEDVLPMHCSANVGKDGDCALFFGLSGTGKTTLSSDPDRFLIGDDEHGWSHEGVFNFEGGCYAKVINLQQEYEPLIWDAVHRFGSVLENVSYNEITRAMNFKDATLTENTRGAYDLKCIEKRINDGKGTHPQNIFFLSADAFGVLPPISLLDENQAMYYFLAGYTAKLAGTERGLGSEPQATFSSCFGAPFLPLSPLVYAKMLQKRIVQNKSRVWLINTGWVGGSYGVGERIHLPYTRAMISTALKGEIIESEMNVDPIFELRIPKNINGVPTVVLDPMSHWGDKNAYVSTAEKLKAQFEKTLTTYQF